MNFPAQVTIGGPRQGGRVASSYDMRTHLSPRRLALLMWDQAFLLRHGPGGSFEDYDRVLDQTVERGYNTVRLDPMPQWLDLDKPSAILSWEDPKKPFLPWDWNTAVEGPVAQWLYDFMEKLSARRLHYTLSPWWFIDGGPKPRFQPTNHIEAAKGWIDFLHTWEDRFGFDRLVYVDIHNEVPYFLPGYREKFANETGSGWNDQPVFSAAQRDWLARDLNGAMKLLHREFPQLRFTASIHGDVRWIDVPLDFDCLDVHFYADPDPRWLERTGFHDHLPHLTTSDHWFKDFSNRCAAAHRAVAPMLRARQRDKVAQFAAWAEQQGMPLTTSESWASWFYFDHKDLDWGWLLDWAEWSVEDAIDFRMWGWTPHNYGQPQFANWNDVKWHQRLTERFLKS